MTTTFLEPGGDATLNVAPLAGSGLWETVITTPTAATDFVHGSHVRSIAYRAGFNDVVKTHPGVVADAGGRISFYAYIVALPNAGNKFLAAAQTGGSATVVSVRLSSTGVLKLHQSAGTQIGSDGPTLSTGGWYRISLAYTITSTTVNRLELFVDGVSAISITNATLGTIGTSKLAFGNSSTDVALDFRTSDHYVDNSSALTDPGDIWVTAKRPVANGATNGFTTQIGSGNSGYGTGHSDEVNERPADVANGWSMVGTGSAVTEEYTIEGKTVGDISIAAADTIVDYMGWLTAKSLASETALIKVGGTTSNIALTSTITTFLKVKGSSTYPAGSTDIGIVTATDLTTVSLYECGILVAFIPLVAPSAIANALMMVGSGI